ncbi:MAG: hypothetical protein JWP13_127 [Candidatus Saccharibacteria bacterium]|nr:hypothetical protein [Candidatus Saccharibacteria bacterium]
MTRGIRARFTVIGEHLPSPIFTMLRHVRLSVIYIAVAAIIAAAWIVYAVKPVRSEVSTPSSAQNNALEVDEPGGTETMNNTTPNEDVSNEYHASVSSDNTGTTVTVNGEEQTVGPNESFDKTYTSENENNSTRTDVSIQNSTDTSISSDNQSESHSSSLHVRMHSSSTNNH